MAAAIPRGILIPVAELAERTRQHAAPRLLPFLFTLYIANYLDRTSLAYAAIGMARDLGFSDRVFGMGAGVFFVSYVALQVPEALLVERWGARRVISLTMIAWGSMTALTALVETPAQLYLARFLLALWRHCFFRVSTPSVVLLGLPVLIYSGISTPKPDHWHMDWRCWRARASLAACLCLLCQTKHSTVR